MARIISLFGGNRALLNCKEERYVHFFMGVSKNAL